MTFVAENLSLSFRAFSCKSSTAFGRVDWFDFVPRFLEHKSSENWIMNNEFFAKDFLVRNVWYWKVGQYYGVVSSLS